MAFEKGISGNPKGRPAGSPNSVSKSLRLTITNFLEGNFSQIEDDFSKLRPFARVKLYIELLQYGIPKLNAVQVQDDLDKLTDEQLDKILDELKSKAIELKNITHD